MTPSWKMSRLRRRRKIVRVGRMKMVRVGRRKMARVRRRKMMTLKRRRRRKIAARFGLDRLDFQAADIGKGS